MSEEALLPIARACELAIEPEEEHWLIEGLWARSAVGIIGGPPKAGKSWLGLDMAVSVASGTRALGHFPTPEKGTVLVYLAEDALPQVRARIEALCRQRGQDIRSLDLHVITAALLRLDLCGDQDRLARTVEKLRPRLLLLDPLVRLHRLDENSASEISGFLGYIRELQRRFDVAVALVHHTSKKQRSQPGQSLRGSSDLHAIGDSNVYLTRSEKHLVLTIEHRASRSPEPMLLELVHDADTDATHLRVRAESLSLSHDQQQEPRLEKQILEALESTSEPMTRAALRARLRVNNQRLGYTLDRLEREGRIVRSSRGWKST